MAIRNTAQAEILANPGQSEIVLQQAYNLALAVDPKHAARATFWLPETDPRSALIMILDASGTEGSELTISFDEKNDDPGSVVGKVGVFPDDTR